MMKLTTSILLILAIFQPAVARLEIVRVNNEIKTNAARNEAHKTQKQLRAFDVLLEEDSRAYVDGTRTL